MDPAQARADVERIFSTVIAELRAERLVERALQLEAGAIQIEGERNSLPPGARLVVVAIGKAAIGMAAGAERALNCRIDRGLVVTKRGFAVHAGLTHFEVREASHPVPDESSLAAGQAVLAAVSGLERDDLVLALISGGGSALVEALPPGITLDDLASTTQLLLRAGADIWLLNAVRQRLSLIKAGGLARAAAPARVVNLLISDVLGSPLPVIASGPSVDPGPVLADPGDTIRGLGIWEELPVAVRRALEQPWQPDPVRNVAQSVVLADARRLAELAKRAAERRGYQSVVLGDRFVGEAREFARFWCTLARHIHDRGEPWHPPVCLIGTGELTVTVRGQGAGGRNTEMALAAALELDGVSGVAVASLASDGDDGISGAAGGVVTGQTAGAIRRAGLDPKQLLRENDSARGLAAAEALLVTGPTGTNVNDLYLAMIR
uniref:DUF4147 domain-containing protein n=1 Tax=Thermorudis peleae TaxID=1382356 RepID=A0A831TEY5_9BACT